jgi:hypothetical protein
MVAGRQLRIFDVGGDGTTAEATLALRASVPSKDADVAARPTFRI